jgi:antitoxin (DNA-binding transcriptional repressor) of toxin-antitoxin stability system
MPAAAFISAADSRLSGERITISRRGVPVADLVRTKANSAQEPKFGTLKEKIAVHDPDSWMPMSDDEVNAFLRGSA